MPVDPETNVKLTIVVSDDGQVMCESQALSGDQLINASISAISATVTAVESAFEAGGMDKAETARIGSLILRHAEHSIREHAPEMVGGTIMTRTTTPQPAPHIIKGPGGDYCESIYLQPPPAADPDKADWSAPRWACVIGCVGLVAAVGLGIAHMVWGVLVPNSPFPWTAVAIALLVLVGGSLLLSGETEDDTHG